jgi:hypothetical protein
MSASCLLGLAAHGDAPRGHAHHAPERGPRPVGYRRPGLQRQMDALPVTGTSGWAAAGRRRSGRVSWAVYNQANTKNPRAVRAARRAFRPSGRSLSSMRSTRLAAPMPIAQVAAYRHGRRMASRAQPSTRICAGSPDRRPGSCSGRGLWGAGMLGSPEPCPLERAGRAGGDGDRPVAGCQLGPGQRLAVDLPAAVGGHHRPAWADVGDLLEG